jgi:hypothetical protein
MADELEAMWGKLTLTEEEKEDILVAESEIADLKTKGEKCIVRQIVDAQAMVNRGNSYIFKKERMFFFLREEEI